MIDNETSLIEMANRLNANHFSVVESMDKEISALKAKHLRYRNAVELVLKDYGSDDEGCTANLILKAINEVKG